MFKITVALALASVSFAVNSKRGLAFADFSNTDDIAVAKNTQVSWVYDWGATAPSYLENTGMTFIPMQWGAGDIENFGNTVRAQGAKRILGFNEPDLESQSNIAPMTAASLWKEYIQPLKADDIRLGSPAVTSGSSGTVWLTEFLANCTECTFDFIPFHWYGEGIENFHDYMVSFHDRFSSWPLWITEFASTSSNVSEVEEFCDEAITELDGLDWIEGYAWFAFYRKTTGSYYNLLDDGGQLNVLGTKYLLD